MSFSPPPPSPRLKTWNRSSWSCDWARVTPPWTPIDEGAPVFRLTGHGWSRGVSGVRRRPPTEVPTVSYRLSNDPEVQVGNASLRLREKEGVLGVTPTPRKKCLGFCVYRRNEDTDFQGSFDEGKRWGSGWEVSFGVTTQWTSDGSIENVSCLPFLPDIPRRTA